jgi:hypothetical protein
VSPDLISLEAKDWVMVGAVDEWAKEDRLKTVHVLKHKTIMTTKNFFISHSPF